MFSDRKYSFYFWLSILMIIALATRLIILCEFLTDNPFSKVFFSDDWIYWVMAGAKAAGNWSPETPFLSSPLFPYLLGAIRWLGGSLKSIYLIQLFLGLASILLIAFGTKKRFGETAGLIAATLFVFAEEPTMTFTRVMADSVQIFLVTLVWFLWSRLPEQNISDQKDQSLIQIIITGAIIGLLVLAWPPAQLLLIGYGAWLLFTKNNSLQKKLLYSFAGMLAGFLIISPATIHNYKTDGEFTLVSTNSGINLLQGNNENAEGIITSLDGIRTDRQHMFEDMKRVYIQANGEMDSWKKMDGFYKNQAIDFIFDQPVKSFTLLTKKFYWFLSSQDYDNISVLSLEQDHGLYKWAKLVPIELPWLMGLSFLGVLLLIRNFHRYTPELLILGLTIFVCVVFHYSARYRLPAAPILCILSAVAFTQWNKISFHPVFKYLIAFLPALFILINLITGFASVEFMRKDTATKISHAYIEAGDLQIREEEYEQAKKSYIRGIETDPSYEAPYLRLAHLGIKTEQLDLTQHWVDLLIKNIDTTPQTARTGLQLLYNAQLSDQKYIAAAKTLEKLIKISPDDLQLKQNLIWSLATNPEPTLRNPEEALLLSKKLLGISTGSARIDALTMLAVAKLSSGNKKSAGISIKKALKMAQRFDLDESIRSLENLEKELQTKTVFDFQAKAFKVENPWDLTKPHPMDLIEY